jgi:recA bacterial DNA recombination protein
MANIAGLAETIRNRFDLPVGIRERQIRQPFASGIAAVDELLGSGFPRTTLSEISGAPSTNRTALTVSVVARAGHAGECCAWVDAAGTLDPETASEAGVDLTRLLWVNCRGNTEHALKAVDLLLHGGGFVLMVFDLADIAERRGTPHLDGLVVSPSARCGGNRHGFDRADARGANGFLLDGIGGARAAKIAVARKTIARHRVSSGNPQALQFEKHRL